MSAGPKYHHKKVIFIATSLSVVFCAITATTLRDFLRHPSAIAPLDSFGGTLVIVLPRGEADPGHENILKITDTQEREAALERMTMRERDAEHHNRVLGRPDVFGVPPKHPIFSLPHIADSFTHALAEFGQVARSGRVDPLPSQEGDPPPPPCRPIDTSTTWGKIKQIIAPVWLFVIYMIPGVTILRMIVWHLAVASVLLLVARRLNIPRISAPRMFMLSAAASIPLLALHDSASNIWWGFEQHHLRSDPPHYAVSLGPFGTGGITLAIIFTHAIIVLAFARIAPPKKWRWTVRIGAAAILLTLFSWPLVTAWINRVAGDPILPY